MSVVPTATYRLQFHGGFTFTQARALVPYLVAGAAVASPVIIQRLSGFASPYGVPRSWLGRVDNLSHFYLPRLGNFRFVLGVSPNSVLNAPETWREKIFLESGHLWLLWVGGIPMLCAFLVWLHLARAGARQRAVRDPDGVVGVASAAARVSLTIMAVLTTIDMHLTLRGASDVLMLFVATGIAPLVLPRETVAQSQRPVRPEPLASVGWGRPPKALEAVGP